jgi:OmpA-OmpF porin, OOP family
MRNALLFCFGFCCALSSYAQTDELKWNIGFHGGLTQYNGDRGQKWYSLDQAAYGFGSISVSRYLNRHFDATFFATRGELGNVQELSSWSTPQDIALNHFRTRLNTANLALRFNFTGPQSFVRPYIYGGVGIILHEKKFTVLEERIDYALPSFGAGLNFRFSDIMSLQIQESFMYTSTDEIDFAVRNNNDAYLYHTVGLTFNMGEKPDEDMDGVTDKKDRCSGTPKGVMVDATGCPLDGDKDGVADYIDDCPAEAGVAALKGCPDKDLDGIADKADRCPDLAGPLALSGCPDGDSDGIADLDDKCPGTKAGYKVDASGCPYDNDKDGLVNEEDRCPDVAGVAGLQGCKDTDGDGVSDIDDRCPEAKGNAANRGCPEIAKQDVEKITLIASRIFFETGSDKLKPQSLAQLDQLAEILSRYPGANLVIEGHTDDVGEDAYNMDLSQRRTESVKKYLVSKGIDASRLTATGYGETRPIDDNKKAAGRAKNRRVELKTSY